MQFPVVGQFNVSRSREWQNQDTINLYGIMDQDAKTPNCLAPLPGVKSLLVLDTISSSVRTNGMYAYNGITYIIAADNFYRYVNKTLFFIQQINSQDGLISWTNNTTEIAFVDSVNYYVYDIHTGLLTVVTTFLADGSPGPLPASPIMCYFQDARIVICFKNIFQFYYSNQGSASMLSVNNFINLQSQPDTAMGVSGSNERLLLFGKLNTEIWAPNLSGGDLPYYRDNNYIFEQGLASSGSLVKGTIEYDSPNTPVINFVFWLSANKDGVGSFVYSTSGIPQKASTSAVDIELSRMTRVSDCYCVVYKESGHTFIECNFPTDNKTLVIDMNTGWWVHKQRLDLSYSMINSHVFVNNQHIVGSRLSPVIYLLSDQFLTEDGIEIKRTRITQTLIDPKFQRISGNKFEVDCEAGQLENNITPYLFIYFSTDGGRTWSNPFKLQMGKSGEYNWKTFCEGLGDGYAYTFKLEVYDPVRVYIFGANFDYTVST